MQHLTARLTADATVKTFKSGRSVVNFNVATNHSYTNRDGVRVTETDYYQCSYWLTEKVAPFLTKGRLVELYGRIGARAYVGRDGNPVAALQLNTSQINFLSAAPAREVPEAETQAEPDAQPTGRTRRNRTAETVTDDLPF